MGADDHTILDAVEEAAQYSIGIAQGIIAERYRIPLASADAILNHRAQIAGIPVVEAARWLLTAGTLP
jgi:hypothetical protein